MTTRAGVSGLGAGLLWAAVLFYPLCAVLPVRYIPAWSAMPVWSNVAMVLLAVGSAIPVAGGGFAAWWGGARSRARRAALGAVAGSLAGLVVFCTLGASAAAVVAAGPLLQSSLASALVEKPGAQLLYEAVIHVVWWTQGAFWALALVGAGLGALGGLYVRPFPPPAGWEEFDRREPQMALNASITAVASGAVAALLAAALFSGLSGALSRSAAERSIVSSLSPQVVLLAPVVTALLIYVISLGALAMVTSHEARRAEHRRGLDEVRMAAWVGIFVPPTLLVLLLLISPAVDIAPLVLSLLLASQALSLRQIIVLRSVILPRRATLPPAAKPAEALLVGSIARSRGPRLAILCAGCGLAMMSPAYVSVGAAVLSLVLIPLPLMPVFAGALPAVALDPVMLVRRLYLGQAALGLGLTAGAAVVLTAIYLFYLWLGRRFARRGEAS